MKKTRLMRMLSRSLAASLVAVAAVAVIVNPPAAFAVGEVGDAGDLPGSAQIPAGGGALSVITGAITSGDEDMYAVCLTDGQTFSASTEALPFVASNLADTQLFLFDSTGMGVYANDDVNVVSTRSLLPAGDPLTPSTSGLYYLAVSAYDNDPLSPGGLIFPTFPFEGLYGPTGPGGAQPVSAWSGGGTTGNYQIDLTGAVFPAASGQCPTPAACASPTITGTAANDILDGSPGPDVIVGLGGDDEINGLAGDDVICGGAGADTIEAGDGNDQVFGEGEADEIIGGSGDDVLEGGFGGDTIDGDSGNDMISGEGGNDTLRGGSGADVINGGAGADDLLGGSGPDDLFGGTEVDNLFGEDGDDDLDGGAGADTCDGGLGSNTSVNCP